jgi:hypothetical protein
MHVVMPSAMSIADAPGGTYPNLFFVGYELASTGHLREIALGAEAVATELARATPA